MDNQYQQASDVSENESTTTVAYKGRTGSRAGSVERREKILKAVLSIIARDGIRGVKHRAVAKEAQVPLASTTYYFKDINDLMTDAFNFFAQSDAIHTDKLKDRSFTELGQHITNLGDQSGLRRFADIITDFAVDHVMSQICDAELQNRVIEQNFQIEATRNPCLTGPYLARWQGLTDIIKLFYETIGSDDPEADAIAFKALIVELETMALLDPVNNRDENKIRRVLRRQTYNSFKVR